MIVLLLLLEAKLLQPSNDYSMSIRTSIFMILVFFLERGAAFAQTSNMEHADSPQTLEWVERQSMRIDSLLNDALLGSEPIEIFLKLTDCYLVFDAISLAGLYCTDVRAAAEAGRQYCDVINYRLEKDLNSKVQRVVGARRQAIRMKEAAKTCRQSITTSTGKVFTPNDLIIQEAQMAESFLLDGLASENIHIMSQKLEWAIRTLYELEHLAKTLSGCDGPLQIAESAVLNCQKALAAPNWTELNRHVNAALSAVREIQQSAKCE